MGGESGRKDISSRAAQFRPYLRKLAARRIGRLEKNGLDPSDIVQQALLSAFEGVERFRGSTDRELRAWLARILERAVSNSVRKLRAAKRSIHREKPFDENRLPDGNTETPSRIVAGFELKRRLVEAILALPEDQRTALRLRYFEDNGLQEIACLMRRSKASVAGLLRRALESLRTALEPLR